MVYKMAVRNFIQLQCFPQSQNNWKAGTLEPSNADFSLRLYQLVLFSIYPISRLSPLHSITVTVNLGKRMWALRTALLSEDLAETRQVISIVKDEQVVAFPISELHLQGQQ